MFLYNISKIYRLKVKIVKLICQLHLTVKSTGSRKLFKTNYEIIMFYEVIYVVIICYFSRY